MYARQIDDREFTFGVSGKLIRNVLVMYDRQTGSYWSQLLGRAIEGELAGTELVFLPSWQTTWARWKEMHPDTVALRKPFRGSRDSYDGYYLSASAGVIGETTFDDRLTTKEFVIGVELPDGAIAYPFRALNETPIINDEVDGEALLVVFDRQNGAGRIYDRRVDGRPLTFAATDTPLVLTDAETGSTWDAFDGVATAGPLAGSELTPVKSTQVFWFGWKDFHTDTLVYGVDHPS